MKESMDMEVLEIEILTYDKDENVMLSTSLLRLEWKTKNGVQVVLYSPFLRIGGIRRFKINMPNHNSRAVVH